MKLTVYKARAGRQLRLKIIPFIID